MGKRKRIEELEKRCDNLEKSLRHVQVDITRLLVWQKGVQRQKENDEDDALENGKIGVPTPGIWKIRSDSKIGKLPLWWWADANGDMDRWRKDEGTEFHSLIEAVRFLSNAKNNREKGYREPVIIEPSGGVYNERDGRDPNAEPIEPKQVTK